MISNTGISKEADKVLTCYQHSRDAFKTAIETSEKAMRYVVNNPYTSADQVKADLFKKPLLKYNIIIPILSTIIGNEQLIRRKAIFKPRTVRDAGVIDILQGRWNEVIDSQCLEEKMQLSFYDALISPMGGWMQRDFLVNEKGYLDYSYKVINNMRVFPDDETKTSDFELKNCRWIVKEGWETLDVIQSLFALLNNVDLTQLAQEDRRGWWEKVVTIYKRITDSSYSANPDYDKENDRYKVLEMQERVFRQMMRVNDGGNSYFLIEPSRFKTEKEQNPDLREIDRVEVEKVYITTMIPFFDHIVVKDQLAKQKSNNFDVFNCNSFGYNVQLSETTSLVALLFDIQDDINKGKSQMRDYVTQQISAATLIDKREKEAIKLLQTKGNQPLKVLPISNMANPPSKLQPDTVAPELLINTENSMEFAHRVSLMNKAMQGLEGKSGESGVLFEQKVARAAAAVNPYYKNLSNMRKALAQDFVDNFDFVYSEPDRVIDVRSNDKVRSKEIINLDIGGGIYHNMKNITPAVEFDEGEDNITVKEQNFERLLAIYNLITQANPELAALLVKDLIEQAPVSGVDKFIKTIDEAMKDQSLAQEALAQLENTKRELENLQLERGIITGEKKSQQEERKLDIEAAKVLKEDTGEKASA